MFGFCYLMVNDLKRGKIYIVTKMKNFKAKLNGMIERD